MPITNFTAVGGTAINVLQAPNVTSRPNMILSGKWGDIWGGKCQRPPSNAMSKKEVHNDQQQGK